MTNHHKHGDRFVDATNDLTEADKVRARYRKMRGNREKSEDFNPQDEIVSFFAGFGLFAVSSTFFLILAYLLFK